jgi:DNA-binding NarL/FixJ family response regulator
MPVPTSKSRPSSLAPDALSALLDAGAGRDARGLAAEVERQYPQFAALAPNERVVAIYASLGYDERQTGRALGQPAAAVKRSLQAAVRQLGLSSKAALVRMTR